MKLRFVSHASFSVQSSNGTTLLCDPWLLGKAFNQGWALLSPAAPVDWDTIAYVWISHQHPDHLHFPTLKSVPTGKRKELTVLYQKHCSARIPKVLRGLGYTNVRELTLHSWTPLKDGLEVMCGSVGSMDSWIAIRDGVTTILNLNDCVLSPHHLEYVSHLVGKVTVLLTQFSFANWIGNHADERGEVERKLSDVRHRVDALQPRVTIPFASFIYFCNEENCWMNDFAITPERVMSLNLPGVNFMYPGDEWESNDNLSSSAEAVHRYMQDIARPKMIDPVPTSVPTLILEQAIERTLRRVRTRFGRFIVGRMPPFTIHLHDSKKVVTILPARGCSIADATPETRESARYVMCSQVAWYAFAYSWGWGAMEVSGMYSDRKLNDANPLIFYLNVMATDSLRFDSIGNTMRTAEFFWKKRHELAYRVWDLLGRRLRTTPRPDQQQLTARPAP